MSRWILSFRDSDGDTVEVVFRGATAKDDATMVHDALSRTHNDTQDVQMECEEE